MSIRILHCIPSMEATSGGPTRALIEICKATMWAQPGAHITIATTEHRMMPAESHRLREELGAVELQLFPQIGRHTSNISPSLFRWCWKNAREFDVIHIHALLHPISTLCAVIARLKKVPYIVRPLGTLSEYAFKHRRSLLKNLYYTLLDSRTVSKAEKVHFTTQLEMQKSSRPNVREKSVVIPIPFTQEPGPESLGTHESTILFIGRLDPVKGLENLIKAFASIKPTTQDLRLVIAGSGQAQYEMKLRHLVSSMGLTNEIEFPGFVDGDRKLSLMRQAIVFVLPSHHENFGLSAVEAMASGLPTIVTRDVDLWPDIEQSNAGLVVERSSPQIAAALSTLINDKETRSTMGKNAAALVRDRYSYNIVGDKLLAMYHSAIKGGI